MAHVATTSCVANNYTLLPISWALWESIPAQVKVRPWVASRVAPPTPNTGIGVAQRAPLMCYQSFANCVERQVRSANTSGSISQELTAQAGPSGIFTDADATDFGNDRGFVGRITAYSFSIFKSRLCLVSADSASIIYSRCTGVQAAMRFFFPRC